MQRTDATLLAQNLNALAEVYERKHVTAKALEVWYDTLKEFPTEKVMGFLIGWPKFHGKFPTPAEVWKSCNESAAGEREERVKRERVENAAPWTGSTAESRRFAAKIRDLLSRPKPSAREHWRNVLETAPVGSIGHQYATEALKLKKQSQEDSSVPF